MRTILIVILVALFPNGKFAEKKVTLAPYLAATETNTGIGVIVCPGGSYCWLDMDIEGDETAKWLQLQGINAFVLRYRVAEIAAYCVGYRVIGLGSKYPNMVRDVEKALEYVYTHADEYNVDTTQIGVMGFSAGGHLTMSSFVYNHSPYKPSFLCPIYPVVTMHRPYVHHRSRRGALGVWGQWNKAMQDSLSLEQHVPQNCPPVFLVNCEDDPVVKYQNSVLLDSALTANNVPHTYIRYKTGGHGFGGSDNRGTDESRQWKQEFIQWISNFKNQNK